MLSETFVAQIFRQGARDLRSENRFVPPHWRHGIIYVKSYHRL